MFGSFQVPNFWHIVVVKDGLSPLCRTGKESKEARKVWGTWFQFRVGNWRRSRAKKKGELKAGHFREPKREARLGFSFGLQHQRKDDNDIERGVFFVSQ